MDLRRLPVEQILQKRKRLRRELLPHAQAPIRIAVLGGVTTSEVVDLLEILLLADGFQPAIYQSEYNRYYEDAVLEPEKIRAFRPDIVYLHTHWNNIQHFPPPGSSEAEFTRCLSAELTRFRAIWNAIHQTVGAQIIQNNFEHPPLPLLGNLDGVSYGGQTRFVSELNLEFAKAAQTSRNLLIQDLNALAAHIGHAQWFDWPRWYSYKILTTPEASLVIARSLTSVIAALRGRAKKCLALDLDNTLWGGVIGDDGFENIQIGKETALAEAYTAFQNYCLALRERGILLAVCSKNDPAIARSGFSHPDSVLKLEHFASFQANWQSKHENLLAIARELNLGLDSIVFVDDNPAERALVAAQLPEVTVPDIGSDVSLFPSLLQATRCFEAVHLSSEDLARAASYAANTARASLERKFSSYGEYLDSLQMTAEIDTFRPVYLERITQLINKTNQFNLTTRRYTFAEIEAIARSREYLALYGKLADAFGASGLVSVIIGRRRDAALHLDLWIMSCRVLKREMELAMLDSLVEHAAARGIRQIIGYYSRTAKNALVQDHYQALGFTRVSAAEDGSTSTWSLDISSYSPRTRHIRIKALVHG
ncbi:MAG TPA: HAD-IIIC family phosphatase [Bryobacteraceae bacterium]|nr:HAD-IIIC family phosphatase [Bryobacteraceae bacterium]